MSGELVGVEIPWLATMSGGSLHLRDKKAYAQWLGTALGDGEQAMVIVVPMGSTGYHAAAFRYYRNCLLPLVADAMGEPNLEIAHDKVSEKFLPVVPAKTRKAMFHFKRKSTSMESMSCQQFCDYIDRLVAWATVDLNLTLPMANRLWKVAR